MQTFADSEQIAPEQRSGRGDVRRGRLTAAFDALASFPVQVEARDRLLAALGGEQAATAELVAVIESDIALTLAVLRLANARTDGRAKIEDIVGALDVLSLDELRALGGCVPTFDFFESTPVWGSAPERVRLHALTTRCVADRIAVQVDFENRDMLAVASLIHDVGKLALVLAYPGYPSSVDGDAGTPSERLRGERAELGIDHALLGGVLLRRWGLPNSLASAVERHHAPDAQGAAAIVRLASMLAHYEHGEPVGADEMLDAARALGLTRDDARSLMYDLSSSAGARRRPVEPCPLSRRELAVLRRLAQGSVNKQIAAELTLSVSTVRSHLHNAYRKLGVANRSQAVLLATERGWLQ